MRYVCAIIATLSTLWGCTGEPSASRYRHGSYDAGVDTPDAFPPRQDASSILAGPQIRVLEPTEPRVPPELFPTDDIVTDGNVTARCLITANPLTGTLVDTQSVRVFARNGTSVVEVAGVPGDAPFEFTGDLDVSGFANGSVAIGCTASEVGQGPFVATAAVFTFIDLGPEIDITSPLANSSHADQFQIELTITPEPLYVGDDLAYLEGFGVSIDGKFISLFTEAGNTYSATIEFDNRFLFAEPPVGPVSILIEARNGRQVPAVRTITIIAE